MKMCPTASGSSASLKPRRDISEENYTVTVKENGEAVKLNIKNSKVTEPPSVPESPKTGDTANLLIPSAALFTALVVIIFLSKKLKKRGYINE